MPTSGPEDLQDICGEPAKWRSSDGKLLCDKHKSAVLEEQPGLEVEALEI